MTPSATYDPTPVAAARALSPKPSLPGCYYDQAAADEAVWFFPWYCRFTQGSAKKDENGLRKISSFAGRAFELAPWQAWIVRQLFGWKRADGTRLYRRCIVWVPRGNGKTNWAAGIAHLALLRLGIQGTEVYAIASKRDQAAIVFNDAIGMLPYSPDLARVYDAPRKTALYCPETDGVFMPLAGKPKGTHGLKCHTLIGDEVHEWRTGDLYTFVRDSQVKWADPIEFLISTAGDDQNGFGHELWDECELIANGAVDDPETLAVIFGAGPDDDLADPKVMAAANPNFGVSISRDDLIAKVRNAKALPRKLPNVKRYNFNIWASDFATWLPADLWAACNARPDDKAYWQRFEQELAGRDCYGAFDGASTRDTNALVWLFPPAGADTRWRILPRFWWPKDSAASQKSGARIPVESWETAGAITLTPGNVADHGAIGKQIVADCARFTVKSLGIDPFNVHQLTQDLLAANVPVVTVPQTMKNLSPAAKQAERKVMQAAYDHGGHPVLKWQAACAAVKEDNAENIMPAKRRSSGKIDGIAALVTAEAVAGVAPEAAPYFYNEPIIFL